MKATELPSGPLLDAVGMGKAIVTTHVNGARDYIAEGEGEGEGAFVMPPGDPGALARALARLSFDASEELPQV